LKVSLVVAVAENGVIGRDGALPWRLPDDSRRFRQLTIGHHVIMGRLTFDSIGRPLPDRTNLVLTRSDRELPPGARGVAGLDEALDIARDAGETETFVIGGTAVYAAALPLANTVHLTEVHARVEGDARFPELDPADWIETEREGHPADERHAHAFTYKVLTRRKAGGAASLGGPASFSR
jgi:dihydrofolate reductase